MGETFQEESPKNDFTRAAAPQTEREESVDGRKQQEDFTLARHNSFCDPGLKWILYAVVFIALVIGVTFLIGYALPSRTTFSRSIKLQQTPEAVFAVLADVRRMAEWNRNTEKVEMLPPMGGDGPGSCRDHDAPSQKSRQGFAPVDLGTLPTRSLSQSLSDPATEILSLSVPE